MIAPSELDQVISAIVDHARRRTHAPTHEAGHAVIARLVGLRGGPASIAYDAANDIHGRSACSDTLLRWRGFDARSARIIASLAGEAAELEFFGASCDGSWADQAHVDELLVMDAAPDRRKAFLWKMTRALVKRNAAAIERVARALSSRGTLSARDLDRMVGMS